MAYVDYATEFAYLKLANNNDQLLVQAALDAAQGWIEDHTMRKFECLADTTRIFDLPNDLHTLPVDTDLLSVTTLTNGTGVPIDATYFYLEPLNSPPYSQIKIYAISPVIFYPSVLGSTEACIQVTGKWAYSLTPPNGIIDATKELAKFFYRRMANADNTADAAVYGPDGSVTYPGKVPSIIWSLIAPYIRRGL